MSLLIKVSTERGEQLRAYAEAQGLGLADAIGALLKAAGAADDVPGFDLLPMRLAPGGKVYGLNLSFGDFGALVPTAMVERLADRLAHCATTSGTGGHEITLSLKSKDYALLTVARYRRHSVILAAKKLPDGGAVTRMLTLDVARDLADQLRRAVA